MDLFPLITEWKIILYPFFVSENGIALQENLVKACKEPFFPKNDNVFKALNSCLPNKVKIVILGQDPYHGEGQANGLAFSVNKGVALPPSLKNIYKAMQNDLGCAVPESGDLSCWAKQGVLLLNTVLTVKPNTPESHAALGWQHLTDYIITTLSESSRPIVFMLWGKYAQKKAQLIQKEKNLILKSAHPSPLSAYRGFFENKHFSSANAYLVEHGLNPVDWEVKD